jgi:hypothetical protein
LPHPLGRDHQLALPGRNHQGLNSGAG